MAICAYELHKIIQKLVISACEKKYILKVHKNGCVQWFKDQGRYPNTMVILRGTICAERNCVTAGPTQQYHIHQVHRATVRHEPNKFLVIDPSWMTGDGTECDKVGVKPKAFNDQPNRCYRPRGSCLGRQPIDLMRKMADLAVDTRVFVGDYVQGRIRYDGATEQLIAEGYQPSVDVMTATAVSDTVCMQGVVEISYDDNGVVTNDRR
ncbi:Generative cell specific-1, HAP2-GCS1 [Cinara cedri]|uniref:Generative cell specific-1, HAP2-GCS1 n=1 Tax=Cinara cedri TaxID=506608 RepID=A0A5E4M528_9HEMI|nr:Generative cell specific-1, HAP2-GCS1 [Cinara cedri]